MSFFFPPGAAREITCLFHMRKKKITAKLSKAQIAVSVRGEYTELVNLLTGLCVAKVMCVQAPGVFVKCFLAQTLGLLKGHINYSSCYRKQNTITTPVAVEIT